MSTQLTFDPALFDSARSEAAATLFREVHCFPSYDEIENGELFSLSLSDKTVAFTHGLHRFPAKFIPRVPGWVIDEFASPNDVILDPFCGSGTTLVEAFVRGKRAIGVDCDALACLISRAKTSSVRASRMRDLGAMIRREWRIPTHPLLLPMPDLRNFLHWFSVDAWGKLQSLLKVINSIECEDDERNFLLCIFSSILRWVSNADDQTQKTYVSGTLKKRPPEVEQTFWKALEKAIGGLHELERLRPHGGSSKVIHGDASAIKLPRGTVDLVVTSPPYLDSVDYMYNFMLEYFWLGTGLGVKDRDTFNQQRRSAIGAKNPDGKGYPPLPQSLADIISEKDIIPDRVTATRAYCHNMQKHFVAAAATMKRDGYYVCVVGNSQTRKGTLPIHDALIRLANDAGFSFEKAFAYRIRRHYMKFPRAGRGGIITMDWVIVLKNAQTPSPYPARLPLPNFTLGDDEVAN